MTLNQTLAAIPPRDEEAYRRACAHWDSVAKPLGSLGLLEEVISRMAALTGDERVDLGKRTVVVLCADNGVVAEGISQSGSGVTALVARQLTTRTTSVCRMARVARCSVLPVDVGILNGKPTPGLLDRRVRNGTGNILVEPAMTRKEAKAALEVGMDLVRLLKESGTRLIATGEMGIGNTTTSSALACALLRKKAADLTGRGAGLDDAALEHKIRVVQAAVENRAPYHDPLDKLAKLGGLDIAAMAGVFLGGALYGVPVLVDGFISAVAALAAVRICPAAQKAVFVTHASAEPAVQSLLRALGQRPFVTAEMRLGEGTGAVASIPLLDMALAVYNGSTFDDMEMEAYKHL